MEVQKIESYDGSIPMKSGERDPQVFPCRAYSGCCTGEIPLPFPIPGELMLLYVKNGDMLIRFPGEQQILHMGDCLAVNANTSCSVFAEQACEWQLLIFHPVAVTGGADTIFAQKYMLPMLSKPLFRFFVLRKGCEKISDFICAFEAAQEKGTGYEFIVRQHLSEISCFLYQKLISADDAAKRTRDITRIDNMLGYIRSHFSEPVKLSDIAQAADIGTRECSRCFQRCLQMSPMQYLIKYRITQSADILLRQPFVEVGEAAAACGFKSTSNFIKQFRRHFHCTPKAYRERFLKQQLSTKS